MVDMIFKSNRARNYAQTSASLAEMAFCYIYGSGFASRINIDERAERAAVLATAAAHAANIALKLEADKRD